jgi:hypothetical protein
LRKTRALIEERDIPEGLKPVILRIAQMTLDFAAQNPSSCRVTWVLERSGPMLWSKYFNNLPRGVRCNWHHEAQQNSTASRKTHARSMGLKMRAMNQAWRAFQISVS